MPQLRIKDGSAKGKVYPLSSDPVQLGREAGVQILDNSASRHHAEVFAIGDLYFLRDLGSRNGTFVNDEPVNKDDELVLHAGDLICIGSTHIVFEEPGPHRVEGLEFSGEEEEFVADIELALDAPTKLASEPETTDADVHFPVLYSLAKACSSSFDVKTLMERICEIALGSTPAQEVYIFVREKGRLVPVAHKRRGEKPSDLKISTTIVRRSIKHKRAILVSDAQSDKRFSASSSVVMQGIRSVVCAPLLAHERVDGALYLHSSTVESTFTDDHLRLVTAIALQAAVAIEAMQAQEESRQRLISVFRAVISAHEDGSPAALKGHSKRVHACVKSVARVLGLGPSDAHAVELAALLHEIGKIGAPEGAFQREENRYDYATLGAAMLRKIDGMEKVAGAVEAHLERLDGSGGPGKLIGHQIPVAARIVGLADEFDRRVEGTDKKVKQSEAIKQALASLSQEVGERYDTDVFNALVTALRPGTPKPA